jgi:hypothetical protein
MFYHFPGRRKSAIQIDCEMWIIWEGSWRRAQDSPAPLQKVPAAQWGYLVIAGKGGKIKKSDEILLHGGEDRVIFM